MMKITSPVKFKFFHKQFHHTKFTILDIGCGNHSPSITKYWFPNCSYHGVDRDKSYNNTRRDIELMDCFYQVDLENSNLNEIPDDSFDIIMMTHVIEHLRNGDEVIEKLLTKLKKNGYLYLEYPGFRSTKLPSMKGTLNFFDDPTHCRLYSQMELYNLFLKNQCKIMKGGVRRNLIFILLTPFRAVFDLVRYGYVNGSVFWDLFGFANYMIVRKP